MVALTGELARERNDSHINELLLYRRVAWRIMPLAIICFLFSYFDRINISFAKTQMQQELGLSDAAYGLAASMFFVGYVLFEVPSSLGLKRYGAPAWICRIMVSWGLATAALVFAYTQYTLYFLRFLIGVMEAGFGPAILFYLACWFPRKHLAKMNGLWFLAVPLAGAVGGPAAGFLLGTMDGVLGLAGWHWLFLMSGLPCVLLGLLVLWKLDRDIEAAKWLSREEKDLLAENLAQDKRTAKPILGSIWRVLLTREVAIMAFIYYVVKTASYGLNFWMPHLIKSSGVQDMLWVGVLSALPYAVACIGMVLLTRHSDRTGERKRYLVYCLLAAAVGYLLACLFSDSPFAMMTALVLATAGTFIAIPIFWTIPQSTFSGLAIATGTAAINSVGQLSGIVAPVMVGKINDLTDSTYMGMLSIAPLILVACLVVMRYVRNPKS
ncbi:MULTISPECIES: MFS transporter [Pseudomonas]|jgi:MFS family permease|uniref:Tartrate MFS transporter n=2 Tax=Pseudomonas putida group TaxID=136845 RepID=Q88HG7_PSEPK|nr:MULTISPECIES: MFS transporter [Pseudomonas]AAN68995.1 putative Tartrate MFS transporter [Pseudomonas putida KT2440]KMU94730.1 MFS transporter permease [Pseudomonas putida]KMY34337.1 MFS transporter permease [Pseudomonas putida]MBP2841535.1 MFS transporter [Pseudomonas sp. PNP]MCE0861572.1 MFS transporter [Pseudomonas alloputida]